MNGESLDLIIASHVIEHTRTPQKVLEKVYKKMRDGGLLVFVVPDRTKTNDESVGNYPHQECRESFQKGS